jgi:hypothetical protein
LDTPNPFTVIATQIQRHGRFREGEGKIFCASGTCEWATEKETRQKRVRAHANHTAHFVKNALIDAGLLPKEESMLTGL